MSDRNERKLTTLSGITGDTVMQVFNKAKEESEEMTLLDLLKHQMSGMVEYSVLGYSLENKSYQWYDVHSVFLINKDFPTKVFEQTQSKRTITIGMYSKLKVVTSHHSLKPMIKLKPTDELLVYSGFEKELEYQMANWCSVTSDKENLYELNILDGKIVVGNGLLLAAENA